MLFRRKLAFTVQMITQTIKPDLAIVTDVCHDTTTPMINQKEQGHIEMGKGPVISYAPAVQNKLREQIIETAELQKNSFPTLGFLSVIPEQIPTHLPTAMAELLRH